jgi:mono/diheme cytochrome c family protein
MRMPRWIIRTLLVLLAGLAGLLAVAYGVSARRLAADFDAPATPLAHAGDAARGERWSRILGCRGCHGAAFGGNLWEDIPLVGRLVASNLTLHRERYDDAQLARAVREGIGADGRRLLVMPADAFQHLDDALLADVIADVRAAPVAAGEDRRTAIGPGAWLALAIAPDQVGLFPFERATQRLGDRRHDDEVALGRFIAMVACAECHGLDLRGWAPEGIPDLGIARAYSLADFRRLLSEGVALGGREVGLMSQVGRSRFAHLTDDEVAALKAFLDSR